MKAVRVFLFVILVLGVGFTWTSSGNSPAVAQDARQTPKCTMVIHGGAGAISKKDMRPEAEQAVRAKLAEALRTGYEILAQGGKSLDAVEASIRVMEDSCLFDAGCGAVFNSAGVNELDAAIMDGRTLAAGSVAGLQHIKNPIGLARRVMEKTPHVMLVAGGAEEFARSQGIELMPAHYFFTEREWKGYERARAADKKPTSLKGDSPLDESLRLQRVFGTVGAVALDQAGNLAAGTSTGGVRYKLPGRVGDSPIIGAGTYANNESCAVSATGTGEFFIRNVVASDICARVRYTHVSIEQATDDVVMKELVAQHGDGGIIALDRKGNLAMTYNTSGMYRAFLGHDGTITVKIWDE